MGLIRPLVPVQKIRKWLSHPVYRWFGYPLAATFGAVTPFCSCSSTPLFIGFLEARIPLGVTFSFLITSPLVNEVALALFIGAFGWKIALLYACAGIFIGILGGMLIGVLKLESWVADFIWSIRAQDVDKTEKHLTFKNLFAFANQETLSITIVPVLQTLVAKGVPLGTAMAFAMAAVGLSTPEAIILKKVMKAKLLFLFFGIVSTGIISVGILFNNVFAY